MDKPVQVMAIGAAGIKGYQQTGGTGGKASVSLSSVGSSTFSVEVSDADKFKSLNEPLDPSYNQRGSSSQSGRARDRPPSSTGEATANANNDGYAVNDLFHQEISIQKKNLKWKTPVGTDSTWELPSLLASQANKTRKHNDATSPEAKKKAAHTAAPATTTEYAVQSSNGTWNYVGKAEEPLERPATRNEILTIAKKYDMAMKVMEETIMGKNSAALDPSMQADIMNMKSQVESEYPYPRRSKNYRSVQKMMCGAFFGQKWTDLVSGQMESQISVLCLEYGSVFNKIRTKSASLFSHMKATIQIMVKEFNETHVQMEIMQNQINDFGRVTEQMRLEFQADLDHYLLEANSEHAKILKAEHDKYLEEKREREKVADAVRVFNGVFNNMKSDQNAMNTADMEEAIEKLKERVKAQEAELKELRPLKAASAALQKKTEKLSRALDEKTAALISTTNRLAEREALCQEILRGDKERLKASEAIQAFYDQQDTLGVSGPVDDKTLTTMVNAHMENMYVNDRPDGDVFSGDEGGEGKRDGGADQGHKSLMDRLKVGNASDKVGPTLCARCEVDMAKTGDAADKLLTELRRRGRQASCPTFKGMLPAMNIKAGDRPAKTKAWVLRVLRAIIFAKQRSDTLDTRSHRLRTTMPELTWLFFEPPSVMVEDMETDELAKVNEEADYNRWSFYNGLKELAKMDLPEAKLFYNLLGERYGEDECTFFMNILRCVQDVCQSTIKWGTVIHAGDYHHLEDSWEQLAEKEKVTDANIWITLEHAVDALNNILAKASSKVQTQCLNKVIEKCVDAKGRIPDSEVGAGEGKVIDLGSFIRIFMFVYREEQASRKAAIRLLFHTATSHLIPTNELKQFTDGMKDQLPVDMHQFKIIVRSLNSKVPDALITRLYRNSFEVQNLGRVCYDTFLVAAEKDQLFSHVLKLPAYCGSVQQDGLSEKQTSELASVVEKHFVLFTEYLGENRNFFQPAELSEFYRLKENVVHQIAVAGNGLQTDGRRSLIAYRRLLYFLTYVKMIQKEETGEHSHPHRVQYVEKELNSLESIISDNNVTHAQELMDKLKLTLAVNKIQYKWRKRQKKVIPIGIIKLLGTNTVNHSSLWPVTYLHKEVGSNSLQPDQSLLSLLKQIEYIFVSKMRADAVDDSCNRPRTSLQEHYVETCLAKFGNRVHSDLQILMFYKSVQCHLSHPRVSLFAKLTAMEQTDEENDEYLTSNVLTHIMVMLKKALGDLPTWPTSDTAPYRTLVKSEGLKKFSMDYVTSAILPRGEEGDRSTAVTALYSQFNEEYCDVDSVLLTVADIEANIQRKLTVKIRNGLAKVVSAVNHSEFTSLNDVHRIITSYEPSYPPIYTLRVFGLVTRNKSFYNIGHLTNICRSRGLLHWNASAAASNPYEADLPLLRYVMQPVMSLSEHVLNVFRRWAVECEVALKNPLRGKDAVTASLRQSLAWKLQNHPKDPKKKGVILKLTSDEVEQLKNLLIEVKEAAATLSDKSTEKLQDCWNLYQVISALILVLSRKAFYSTLLAY